MNKIITLILTYLLTISMGHAQDDLASKTFFKTLSFSKYSVKIIKQEERSEGHFQLQIAFKITPTNTCSSNYVGLFRSAKVSNSYNVIYSSVFNAACGRFGQKKIVTHKINISVRNGQEQTLGLNNESYKISNTNGVLTMQLIQ